MTTNGNRTTYNNNETSNDFDLRKTRAAQFFEKFLAEKLRLGDQAPSQDITIDERKPTLDKMTPNPTILGNFADQFNYAVMLASLAASQMNFIRAPLGSGHEQQQQHRHRSMPGPLGHLPLLYPNLCDSLFNNVQQQHQQKNLEQQKREQLIHKLFDLKENGSKSLPATTEKDAAFSPRTKGQTTKTPSPRKRVGSFKTISRKGECQDLGCTPKKIRAMRRIQFDDEKCSPVSGMYIKDLPSGAAGGGADVVVDQSLDCSSVTNQNYPNNSALRNQPDGGDQLLLDDSADWVEASEDARRQLAEIPNIIGDYVCKLCRRKFDDAFKLAKHKCPRIGHQEYRCPECDKTFSCPANLASHRRWHKPKNTSLHQETAGKEYGEAPEDPQAPVDLTNKKS